MTNKPPTAAQLTALTQFTAIIDEFFTFEAAVGSPLSQHILLEAHSRREANNEQ